VALKLKLNQSVFISKYLKDKSIKNENKKTERKGQEKKGENEPCQSEEGKKHTKKINSCETRTPDLWLS